MPTLILHREGDRLINVGNSRYMASRIPNARYVELDGVDHLPWFGDADAVLDLIEEFLTGVRPVEGKDRVLCTVLFIDIVESTERALTMGDSRWRDLLRAFQLDVKQELDRFRGRLIDTAGDGVFASFDGPARAVRCASRSPRPHVTAWTADRAPVCTLASAKSQATSLPALPFTSVLALRHSPSRTRFSVSSTVKDLVAGSGLSFSSRGRHRC